MKQHSKLIGGILLVSGTTIGAGMLALPVSTGMAGFFPALLLMVAYWIYMTFTAFLILEANLWMKGENNLISMANLTLGKFGKAASWLIYLFLLYSLTTAYIAGAGSIIVDAFEEAVGIALPNWLGAVLPLIIFGFFVYKGTRSVDYINRLLMIGLVVTYVLMMIFLSPHIDPQLLGHIDFRYLWMGVSMVATSFGFHIIIPSLVTYLNRDVVQLKKVILIGSITPLLFYISWELLALGIIPLEGAYGIMEGYANGSNGVHLMTEPLGASAVAFIATFFSLFAIITSFLGVSLSLSDFLADGLSIEKTRVGRILLYLMTFAPPLVISLIDPRAFLSALEYAGAFGVVTLLGLMPALMVWSGRYVRRLAPDLAFRTPGGKLALLAAIAASVSVIALEIAIKLGA